jgi:hypothetical protein
LYDLKPTSFGRAADNFVTLSSNYGDQIERWHGVDVGISTRLVTGLQFQGGLSTGSWLNDVCDVAEKVPEMLLGTPAPGGAGAAVTPQVVAVSSNNGAAISGQWVPAQFCRKLHHAPG